MKKAFHLCSLFLTFLLLFPSCDATDPNIEDETTPSVKWDGTASIWLKGTGTQADPYQIETAEHLAYLAQQVNLGTTYEEKYFKLINDLNLDGSETKQWTPIGGYTNGVYTGIFKGRFDGNNKIISKLYINKKYDKNIGLFGYIGSNSGISNVGLNSNCTVIGKTHVGGIVGYLVASYNVPVIKNCFNKGLVTADDGQVGGIVGTASGTTIDSCYNTGAILGARSVGGIVGFVPTNCITVIKKCYNKGSVTSTGNNIGPASTGGIVGAISSVSSTLTYCFNEGAVKGASVQIAGTGGIVGDTYAWVSYCYNKGSVTSTNKTNLGGIAGYVISSQYAYSLGIEQCYNSGSITGTSDSQLGGIVGYLPTSGSVSNSYYLSTCVTNGNSHGTSKTQAEIKATSMITLLNTYGTPFKVDYSTNINGGYPILNWQ